MLPAGSTPTAAAVARARTLLEAHPYLAPVPEAFRTALLDRCRWTNMAPGAAIGRSDDAADGMFAVGDGAVVIASALGVPDAGIAHVIHPGEWFGNDVIFTRLRRTADTNARLPTLLAHLPLADVEQLAAAFPDGWRWFGLFAVRSTQTAVNILTDMMITDSRRRCLATLLRLAGARFATPDRRPLLAPVSQSEIAAMVNLSRNSVNAILRAEARAGLITIGYGSITLRDPDALRWIVDEG